MSWVIKEPDDEYLVDFETDCYLQTKAKDWSLAQSFAHRFDDRNIAVRVARRIGHGARVVRLAPPKRSGA